MDPEAAARAATATARDELHFAGHGGEVPEDALDLVTAFARGAPLAPVARLRTQRRRWSLRDSDGEELAELVDDRVSVLRSGRVVERFRELEIEGRTLDRAGLERIAEVLQRAGASTPQPVPKVMRALGTAGARAAGCRRADSAPRSGPRGLRDPDGDGPGPSSGSSSTIRAPVSAR